MKNDCRLVLLRSRLVAGAPHALAAGTIFLLAALGPVLDTLGNRGYRAAQLEAGIWTGRIYLGAYASGFATTASTFYDDDVTCFVAPSTGRARPRWRQPAIPQRKARPSYGARVSGLPSVS